MKNILKVILVAFFGFGLSSCLKDVEYDNDMVGLNLDDAAKVIELGQASVSANERTVGLPYVDESVTTQVLTVRLASKEPAKEDIKVTIDTVGGQSFITEYNTAHNIANPLNIISIEKLPNSFFTFIDGFVVTIPKGGREASIRIRTNAIQYNTSTTYALYFKIASVDKPGYIISRNFGQYLTKVSAKNDYDGIYSYVSGLVTRYTSPGVPQGDALSGPLSFPPNPDVRLITTGGNSVNFPPAGSAGQLTWSGGTNGVAGIDGLKLVVDPATFLVTVTSAANASLSNWAGKINKYDPLTKTFTLGFRWNPTASVREYEVILKYKGPRP